ncbi:hypothetical protein GCM10009869_07650 [Amnibacterium kyonggiense]
MPRSAHGVPPVFVKSTWYPTLPAPPPSRSAMTLTPRSVHWFAGRPGSGSARVVVGSGVAVGAVSVGVGAALEGGADAVGATVIVGEDVGCVACDPHPVSASTSAAPSAAPPRTRMAAP